MKNIILISLFLLNACSSGDAPETTTIDAQDTFDYKAEIEKYSSDFRICFERFTPSASKVSLKTVLIVAPNGDITKKQFYANQKITEELSSCLSSVVKEMDFPSPQNGGTIQVTHQMNFKLRK